MLRPKDGISMEDKLAKSQNLKSPPKIQPGGDTIKSPTWRGSIF